MSTSLKNIVERYNAQIQTINKNLSSMSAADMDAALTELKKVEAEYKKAYQKIVFTNLEDVHTAVIQHTFPVVSHTTEKDDNGVTTAIVQTTRDIQIDLKAYCEHKGFDTAWYYDLEAFNKRLLIRAAIDLYKDEKAASRFVKSLDNSVSMSRLAGEIDLGKTPQSNNQTVAHLQRIVDAIDPGCGKVTNHDVAFIEKCHSSKGKAVGAVSIGKSRSLMNLFGTVLHIMAVNGSYTVESKMIKTTVATPEVAETSETSAKKSTKKATKKSTKSADTVADTVIVEPEVA